ncbi:hypothetical protein ASPZODRAFT_131980 [Penicilliopsis zonata CBS 506.65]|uniref:LYR motif-containing protein Cup1-like N-terminal domain-containing protein n=1 Tax=Penicilliopsis zonata CBS 506.65 TaxID=1073090 RepID=A0A1L9SIJ0_9EURO|nr:hypothetical protein ASPZODRAFT_131980 [Penicilliopsis zonata CBS 506.65]OJJ47050.1 hypothetical protein ASPZODRAFT_131980 [Penicilliopsis zonata CBS 506.65]
MKPFVPSERWRSLLRALLRECSYLPDPVARKYMHEMVLQRYRHHAEPKSKLKLLLDPPRQVALERATKQRLSFLKRANEGYTKPLEKVLFMSYGRTGKRRWELVTAFLTPDTPVDTMAVKEVINQPGMFDDGWAPPPILVGLLRSQLNSQHVAQVSPRLQIKDLRPVIPKQNVWGRPLAWSRKRNIRKRWYQGALDSVLPPLPESDLDVLKGLVTGTSQWAPPVKRKKQIEEDKDNPGPSAGGILSPQFLVDGPQKGPTFGKYVDGRPHQITRRFMQRLWRRVYSLVPDITLHPKTNRPIFNWHLFDEKPNLAITLGDGFDPGLFENAGGEKESSPSVQGYQRPT